MSEMTELERRCYKRVSDTGYTMTDSATLEIVRAVLVEAGVAEMTAERDKLQRILDSRPAINAGLPDSYIKWSQGIYAIDLSANEVKQ